MFQVNIQELDFTVAMNSCYDEIMSKMQTLTNMEVQLLRKFQHQINNSQMHYEMIHDVRNTLVNLEEFYKDVKSYFNQIKTPFIYDFFRKIHVLMVYGFNFLSQALIVNIDRLEDRNQQVKLSTNTNNTYLECKSCKCTCSPEVVNKKKQIREVQQYDYRINALQNEQQKLSLQINSIYDKIMLQKPLIQKTKPSLAIRQLEAMKQHLQSVLQSTNTVFQQTYMMKYVQFKNYVAQIKKPEDMIDYFITNMSFNIKDKFVRSMTKAIFKAQNLQHQLQRKNMNHIQVQTDRLQQASQAGGYRASSSLKPQKNQNLLTKQRKNNEKIMNQMQFIKRQLNTLTTQNQRLKKLFKIKDQQKQKYRQNYQTLQILYGKKTYQLQSLLSQNLWLSNDRQNESKKLRLQIKQLKKIQIQTEQAEVQACLPPDYLNNQTQTQSTDFQVELQNQVIHVLKKNNQKMIIQLNEKQRKNKELKIMLSKDKDLRQIKTICIAFLLDIGQVMMKQLKINKKDDNYYRNCIKTIKLSEQSSNQEFTKFITLVSHLVKDTFLSYPKMVRSIDRRRSSVSKQIVSSFGDIKNEELILFSRNSKRNSTLPIQNIKNLSFNFKQQQIQQSKSSSDSNNSQKAKTNQLSQKNYLNQQKSYVLKEKAPKSQRLSLVMKQDFNNKLYSGRSKQRKMSHFNTKQMKDKKFYNKNLLQQKYINDGVQVQLIIPTDQIKNRNYVQFQEIQVQTDIDIQVMKQIVNGMNKYPNFSKNGKNSINNQSKVTNKIRKASFIKKFGIQRFSTQRSKGRQSQLFNSNDKMTNQQILQFLVEQMANGNDLPLQDILYPEVGIKSLQERLSDQFNKINPNSKNSPLISFKKMTIKNEQNSKSFDQIKMSSTNNLKNQYLKHGKTEFLIDRINLNKNQKDNKCSKTSSKIFYIKDKQNDPRYTHYMQGILQEQDFLHQNYQLSRFQSKNTDSWFVGKQDPLLNVSKKQPQQRISPAKLFQESIEANFLKSIRQMFMRSEPKQTVVQKINKIYENLQKQKKQKHLDSKIKPSYTSRSWRKKHEQPKSKQTKLKLIQMMF